MKFGLLVAFLVWFGIGGVKAYERHQEHRRALNPALTPGAICDQVAARKEPRPTVAWYHACINYAADIQHGTAQKDSPHD